MSSCDYIELAQPGVRRLQPYLPGKPIEELKREYGVEHVIKLASNENPLGPSPLAMAAIQQEFRELARYPDGNGFVLKQALSKKYACDAAQITLGNGSNDILELVGRAYAGSGDEIIISEHAFAIYGIVARVIGATAVITPAVNWGHDLVAMAAAITDRTRIIFLANPNNPTGTSFSDSELRDFLQQIPEQVLVVLDEAYFEYAAHPAMGIADYPNGMDLLDKFPNLIVARTFSKAYGLAGLRVGYGISHPQVANILNRVRQPFNVNSMAMRAAAAALDDNEHLHRSVTLNAAGMQQYQTAFTELGLDWIPSAGNFISVAVGGDAAGVYDALLRKGVIVRPVANYGMPGYLRVSIGLESENQQAIQALRDVLDK
ncbi:MAG: histidinol-phosphate transaminase [Gammaproteobacteria bacterium]|nr:histidinol-phosphate transaminase [Gammaproteobacteria bacterium]MDH5652100.1 histidinol-phosphate transaminase [Gammaproteobacteria bacterium]